MAAALLTASIAACGATEEKQSHGAEPRGGITENPKAGPSASSSGRPSERTGKILARVKGDDNLTLSIEDAYREEEGPWVTVLGEIRNGGRGTYHNVNRFGMGDSDVEDVRANPGSVSSATLIDAKSGKQYYVLRDTAKRCLCTTNMSEIEAGDSAPFTAKFPAPPKTTTEVDFQLRGFRNATISLNNTPSRQSNEGAPVTSRGALARPQIRDIVTRTSISDGQREDTEANITFTLNSEVLFDKDSAALSARAKDRIGEVAQQVTKEQATRVVISGYTDNLGSAAHGDLLSRRRAESVRKQLEKDVEREVSYIVHGYGERRPVGSNASEEGRKKNRRVEIAFDKKAT